MSQEVISLGGHPLPLKGHYKKEVIAELCRRTPMAMLPQEVVITQCMRTFLNFGQRSFVVPSGEGADVSQRGFLADG